MHITLVISSLDPGGAERVLSQLANHWASQGHKVSLLTLAAPDAQPFYPLNPKINLRQLNQRDLSSWLLGRLFNIGKRLWILRKSLKSLSPDVIVSFVDVMNMTTLLATYGLNLPVVVSERTHPRHHPLPSLYKRLRPLIYPKAARVVVQTQSSADYFPSLMSKTVIPNAVPKPSKIKSAFSEPPKQMISIGRLCPFKGFDTLIHAFNILQKTHPNLTLTIYGEGKERQKLEDLIGSLTLQDKVSLPGVIQNIHDALREADLFVFPTLYEGFPNALCEAMAIGLPVIASDASGNVDIVQDGTDGRLFPVGDTEALARIVGELINDEAQRLRLGENAQRVCERFHTNHIFSLWDQVIGEAIQKPRT